MIRVWEYDVPESSRDDFERVYGRDGQWAQLFSASNGYEGTELFVSVSDPERYLTIDRFSDQAAWQRFLEDHRDGYLRLDALRAGLTRGERELVGSDVD